MSNLKISDHALLRLIDHTGAMSVDAMREQLHASLASAVDAVRTMGPANFTIRHGGLIFVLNEDNGQSVLVDVAVRKPAKAGKR